MDFWLLACFCITDYNLLYKSALSQSILNFVSLTEIVVKKLWSEWNHEYSVTGNRCILVENCHWVWKPISHDQRGGPYNVWQENK
jgi:hypothetical protein